MIIDAHHHLGQPDRGYHWLDDPALAAIRRPFTPADLTAALTSTGVDGTVLVDLASEAAAYVHGTVLAVDGG
ncbi:hypothetical protein [Micromonospora schwarzwaldensis]|uniref:hypothetical protein n=1 Tax=Micromonospora sp. DSM 45708 TaxID=3111767 RepID=UPI0031E3A655